MIASDKMPSAATLLRSFLDNLLGQNNCVCSQKSVAHRGIKVPCGMAREILTAFRVTAFVSGEGNESLNYHLANAEIIVLDYQGGASPRLAELKMGGFHRAGFRSRDHSFLRQDYFLSNFLRQ